MDKIKKPFMYIKKGKLLHGQDGFAAKVEDEADEIFKEIKEETEVKELATQNVEQRTTSNQNNDEITLLLDDIRKVFEKGPLTLKPSVDTRGNAHFKSTKDRFRADASGQAKCYVGKSEIGSAEFEASISGRGSITHKEEEEEESCSENSYKYSSGKRKVEASGELKGRSRGHVAVGHTDYKAMAEYQGYVHLKVNANASATRIERANHEKNGETRRSLKVAHATAEVGTEVKANGQAKAGIKDSKHFQMEAELQASAKAEGKAVGLQVDEYACRKQYGGQFKAMHAKAKGQVSVDAKGAFGEKHVAVQARATADADVKGIDGRFCLGNRSRTKGEIIKPGVLIEGGQAKAKADACIDFKSDTLGNQKGKASAEAKVGGIRVRAFGARAKAEENSIKAKAALDMKAADVNVGNANVIGRKKGVEVEAKAKASGLKVNVGNASITVIDNSQKARAVAEASNSVNVGNIKVTGLGSKSVNCEAEADSGVSAFNLAIGLSRETSTGASTPRFGFGNINMTLGPPSCKIGSDFGGFNLAIPFFSADGGGSGGGGSGGHGKTNPKHDEGNEMSNRQLGEEIENEGARDEGESNQIAQGETSTNTPHYSAPFAGGMSGSRENGIHFGNYKIEFNEDRSALDEEHMQNVLHGGNNTGHCYGSSSGRSAAWSNGRADVAYGLLLANDENESDRPSRQDTEGEATFSGAGKAHGLKQIADGSVLTHEDNAKAQASGCDENYTLESASTYNERLQYLIKEKMTEELGECARPSQHQKEAKSPGRICMDKKQIKQRFIKGWGLKMKPGPVTERGGGEGPVDSPKDEEHKGQREKVPAKKPFGEKKNIHTIFTMDGGDTRPLKRIKNNVVCFGDE